VKYILLTALSAMALSFSAHAADRECEYDKAPSLPDGSSASYEEMVEAQGEVQEYIKQSEFFIGCLKQKETQLGEDITEEQKAKIVSAYNHVVDEMKATSEQYNAQIKAFKQQ